jgi:hypothetical protein
MSILEDLIPEVIPSQKCHVNMGLILNGYGGVGIWNVASLEEIIYGKTIFHCMVQYMEQTGKEDYIVQYSTLNKLQKKITLYSLHSQ